MTPEVLTQQIVYFRRVKPRPGSLSDIWVPDHPLTVQTFLERIQDGGWPAEDGVWKGNSMTVIETYVFGAYDVGCIRKQDRDMTAVYHAFKGTFIIPKLNDPRALRDRESKRGYTYRQKQRAYRDFLYNLFADFK